MHTSALNAGHRLASQGVDAHLQYDAKGDLKNGGITLYKVVGGKWTTLQSVGGK